MLVEKRRNWSLQVFDIQELQREAQVWTEHNFPNNEPWMPIMGMAEEIGELQHACLKLHQGIRGDRDQHLKEMADAFGDVFIYALNACTAYGLDLQTCIQVAWEKVKQRDWQKNHGDGVTK